MNQSVVLSLIFVVVLLFTAPVSAQGDEVVDRKEIELLLDLSYDTKAIIAYLEDGKRELKLDLLDIRFMRKRGVEEELLTWLQAHLPQGKDKLDLAGVIQHWKDHKDEAKLLKLIEKHGLTMPLSVQDTLGLMREGVPKSVLVAIRASKTKETVSTKKKSVLNLDDIVLMASNGKSEAEIMAAIKATEGTFDIDAAKILELKSDGLSIIVLQELYMRRKEIAKETPATSQPSTKPTEEKVVDNAKIVLFSDKGTGISMFKPERFVTSKEFQGPKALIQMVAPLAEGKDALPELELSIMVVHPRNKSQNITENADLLPIAKTFADGLKRQFAKDDIDMVTEEPTHTWIANSRALRIATQAQVKNSRTGYVGASYLLQDKRRFIVVSYSMRLEKAHIWRPILENCVQSIVLSTDVRKQAVATTGTTKREQALSLFESWRKSIRRLDYETYQNIHYGMTDSIASRTAFLNLARGINEAGNRVEINGVDFERNIINYNVFSVDGMSKFQLGFAKNGTGWVLTTRRSG